MHSKMYMKRSSDDYGLEERSLSTHCQVGTFGKKCYIVNGISMACSQGHNSLKSLQAPKEAQ